MRIKRHLQAVGPVSLWVWRMPIHLDRIVWKVYRGSDMRQFSQMTMSGTVGSTAIRKKDDLPKIPRRFLADVKALNVNGKTYVVLCVRTDNGGEYTGAEFENILLEHLIYHEYSNPSEQFQNGVSE